MKNKGGNTKKFYAAHRYAARVGFLSVWGQKGKVATALVVAVLLAFCFVSTLFCAFSSPERALAVYLQEHPDEFSYFSIEYYANDRAEYEKTQAYLSSHAEYCELWDSQSVYLLDPDEWQTFGFTPVVGCQEPTEDAFYFVMPADSPLREADLNEEGWEYRGSYIGDIYSEECNEDGTRNVIRQIGVWDAVIIDGEEIPYKQYMEENGLTIVDLIGCSFRLYDPFMDQYEVPVETWVSWSSTIPGVGSTGETYEGTKRATEYGFIGEEAWEEAKAKAPVLRFGGILQESFKPRDRTGYAVEWGEKQRAEIVFPKKFGAAVAEQACQTQDPMCALVKTESVQDIYALFQEFGYDISKNNIQGAGLYSSDFHREADHLKPYEPESMIYLLSMKARLMDTMRNVGLGASGVLAVLYMVMTSLTFASSFKKRKHEFALMQAVGVPRRKVLLYCLAALGVFAGVILAAGIVAAWPLVQLLRVFVHMEWQGTVMTLVTLSGETFGVLAAFVVFTALPAALLAAKSVYGGSVADRLREE